MNRQIIPGAEPIYRKGNETGCLVIHGFTGVPNEMRGLADYLAAKGYSVLVPRLAGHGTTVADLIRTRNQDWIASVEDAWAILASHTERIYLIGLSMGGVLALHGATSLPSAGIVIMAAPYELPVQGFLAALKPLAPILSLIVQTLPSARENWFDLEAEKCHIFCPRQPVRSGIELDLLIAKTRTMLGEIRSPALLIYSKDDRTVPIWHGERIYDNLGSPDKQKLIVEGSCHVLTMDAQKERVFAAVGAFIENRE